jgi:glycosyltransferase involved in cell wall biosynthesis
MPPAGGVEPEISIVVPTRDRATKLRRCLEALGAQQTDAPLQIVVVDDGSTDDTARVLASAPAVESVRRPRGGRAAARNPGVERARGAVVLFIDDDVVATDGLVQRHLDHHRRHPAEHEALIGRVTWAPELEITPHMLWLEDGGPLFAFNEIADPESVDWRHFCTANASVKRSFLPSEQPFDEELQRCVDIELGYRLQRSGMRLRYDAEALGHHLRVDTPRSTEVRMREVGRAMRRVHHKHPELVEPPAPFTPLSHVKAALARPVDPVLRRLGVTALEERLYSYRAARAYAQGYAESDRVLRGAGEARA